MRLTPPASPNSRLLSLVSELVTFSQTTVDARPYQAYNDIRHGHSLVHNQPRADGHQKDADAPGDGRTLSIHIRNPGHGTVVVPVSPLEPAIVDAAATSMPRSMKICRPPTSTSFTAPRDFAIGRPRRRPAANLASLRRPPDRGRRHPRPQCASTPRPSPRHCSTTSSKTAASTTEELEKQFVDRIAKLVRRL